MKKIVYIPIFFLALSFVSHGQKNGYMGKRFMVKVNVLNGLRPLYAGGELEYAIHRNISISFGGGYQTGLYKQRYYKQYEKKYSELYYRREVTKAQTRITSYSLYGQLKYFPTNGLIGAPNGFYINLKGGLGFADIESKSGKPVQVTIGQNLPKSWTVKNILFQFYELGAGYQKIFGSRIVIDAGLALNFTHLNSNPQNNNLDYTATVAPEFGPNTIWKYTTSYSPVDEKGNYIYGPFGKNEQNPNRNSLNVGLSTYLKVGILIF